MLQFKHYFGRVTEELPGSGVENAEDENGIIGNQDETLGALPQSEDEVMGGMGTGDYGLSAGGFATGEIDLVDQMARTTRAADKVAHREEDVFPGFDTATEKSPDDEDDEQVDEDATTH